MLDYIVICIQFALMAVLTQSTSCRDNDNDSYKLSDVARGPVSFMDIFRQSAEGNLNNSKNNTKPQVFHITDLENKPKIYDFRHLVPNHEDYNLAQKQVAQRDDYTLQTPNHNLILPGYWNNHFESFLNKTKFKELDNQNTPHNVFNGGSQNVFHQKNNTKSYNTNYAPPGYGYPYKMYDHAKDVIKIDKNNHDTNKDTKIPQIPLHKYSNTLAGHETPDMHNYFLGSIQKDEKGFENGVRPIVNSFKHLHHYDMKGKQNTLPFKDQSINNDSNIVPFFKENDLHPSVGYLLNTPLNKKNTSKSVLMEDSESSESEPVWPFEKNIFGESLKDTSKFQDKRNQNINLLQPNTVDKVANNSNHEQNEHQRPIDSSSGVNKKKLESIFFQKLIQHANSNYALNATENDVLQRLLTKFNINVNVFAFFEPVPKLSNAVSDHLPSNF